MTLKKEKKDRRAFALCVGCLSLMTALMYRTLREIKGV